MTKLPCEVVRDLFPSYMDELTSRVSNEMIEDHLKDCRECREVLEAMRAGTQGEEAPGPEAREIDFLKKNKRRNRRILVGSLLGALFLVLAIALSGIFLIGHTGETAWAAMDLKVDGRDLSFQAVPSGSAEAIADLAFSEEDGTVTVTARSVLASPFHPGSLAGTYQAGEEIRQVRIGDRIVWSEGATVSALASDLFALRHSYAGDMPANGALAQALGLTAYLGPYTNELETETEPYGWKILLEDEIDPSALAQKEQDMDAFGRVLVALTGNLDHVTYVYRAGGEDLTRTITAADAGRFLGEDIKTCGEDIRALDRLIGKTGLSLYAVSGTPADGDCSTLIIRNLSDQSFSSYGASYYKDGVLCSSGGGANADGSSVGAGEEIWVIFSAQEFGGWEEGQVLELELSFEKPDGTSVQIPEKVRVAAGSGRRYEMELTGNETDGYRLGW